MKQERKDHRKTEKLKQILMNKREEIIGGVMQIRASSQEMGQDGIQDMADEQLAALRSHPSVHAVEVRPPSLEEIFVAYMQPGSQPGRQDVAEEVQAQ